MKAPPFINICICIVQKDHKSHTVEVLTQPSNGHCLVGLVTISSLFCLIECKKWEHRKGQYKITGLPSFLHRWHTGANTGALRKIKQHVMVRIISIFKTE